MELLLSKLNSYLPESSISKIRQAYTFASTAHRNQSRLSGEPYIEHPVQTALLLADLKLDVSTVMAGLLHDVMEDCQVPFTTLEAEFGREVAKLVDGVTKLAKLDSEPIGQSDKTPSHITNPTRAENLQKMLISMAEDVRVVLIKLADRLHNMNTLKYLPEDRQQAIARETLDIYSPLAHRLGMGDIKWKLEDLSFHYINPERYKTISKLLASKRQERELYIATITSLLNDSLNAHEIESDISGRPKHIYSIHQKMNRYASQGKDFSEIYDLFAVRVLVKEVPECYRALGVVHSLWQYIPNQFDDYIANPKENMYQSLHTSVRGQDGTPIEIQIRTFKMHELAEYGVAAHWDYKENGLLDQKLDSKLTWMRQILEWQTNSSGAEEFVETVKSDIFGDQVFVYTPKGEIKELPLGSTPVDFAYRVHTDLGHRSVAAKANGKLVPFNYILQNGDTIEVLTTDLARGPSIDWLNPNLGYTRTASAREKIRQWFRKEKRGIHIERGKELLTKELRKLGIPMDEKEAIKLLKLRDFDELLAKIGSGETNLPEISLQLAAAQEKTSKSDPKAKAQFNILGAGDLVTTLSSCCNPQPEDSIIGCISDEGTILVHSEKCSVLAKNEDPKKIITLRWGTSEKLQPVRLEITAWDRVGLLRDITSSISGERVNISSVITNQQGEGKTIIESTVFITGINQLSKLFGNIESIKGIIAVKRKT